MKQGEMVAFMQGGNREEALAAAAATAAKLVEEGQRCTVIAASFDDAAQLKALLGAAGGSGLGVRVTTFELWLEDEWQLWGDGRVLIAPVQRLAVAWEAVRATEGLPGAAAAAAQWVARAAREALPWLTGEPMRPLEGAEVACCNALRLYGEMLSRRGLVERSEACWLLGKEVGAGQRPVDALLLAGLDPDRLGAAERWLLEQVGATASVNRRTEPPKGQSPELRALLASLFGRGQEPVVPEGRLRMALPSGKSAEPRMLADVLAAVSDAVAPGGLSFGAVVADTAPMELFERLRGPLEAAGLSVALRGSVPFGDTWAGRFVAQWAAVADGGFSLWADVANNPLAGLSQATAAALVRKWAADRAMGGRRALQQLAERSSACAAFSQALADEGPAAAVEALQPYAHMAAADEARRGLESAALASFAALCRQLPPTAGLGDAVELASSVKLPIGWAAGTPSSAAREADVLFATLDEAAQLPAGCAGVLVLTKMNRDERPSAASAGSLEALAAKFGLQPQLEGAEVTRRQLWDALCVPVSQVVLERTLSDSAGDPAYPHFLMQEIVDCYRADPSRTDDLVKEWELPRVLVPFAETLPETRFAYNLAGEEAFRPALRAEVLPTGQVSSPWRPLIALPKVPGESGWTARLSPSAIESLLSCPYLWFVQRRLCLKEAQEGFGPLERGTFVHEVMQRFHEQLVARGVPRVRPDNLEECRGLLAEVFRDAEERQAAREPGHRYLPVTPWEEKLREGLLPQLSGSLWLQADWLEGFRPAYHEWHYGFDRPVPYGGVFICGSVDRIDVDDKGRAVVIDYKTSLGADYRLVSGRDNGQGGEEQPFQLPRRVQALIYARVIQRLLDVDVVATLYVNPLDGKVEGAFDAAVLGPESIPGIRPDECSVQAAGFGGFRELLDAAERMVAQRLQLLWAGDIWPNPADKEACRYCPAVLCERRLS